MSAEQIRQKIPGVPLFDVCDVFAAADQKARTMYLDWRHLNIKGAWVVHTALARLVNMTTAGD